jgi:hypothetical protein
MLFLLSATHCLPFNDDEVLKFRSRESVLFKKVLNELYDKDQRPPGVEHVGKNFPQWTRLLAEL